MRHTKSLGRLGTETVAALRRARYWAGQIKWSAAMFTLALVGEVELIDAIRQTLPRGRLSIDNTLMPVVCVFCAAIVLWSAWGVAKKIRADGVGTFEKGELEAGIAMLRGAARAQKEAELIRSEIDAVPNTDLGLNRGAERCGAPKRL